MSAIFNAPYIIASSCTIIIVYVSQSVIKEVKRIIQESEITQEDDANWPEADKSVGKQELEIKIGNEHICFSVKSFICFIQLIKVHILKCYIYIK